MNGCYWADTGLTGSRRRVDLGNPCSASTTHAGIRHGGRVE